MAVIHKLLSFWFVSSLCFSFAFAQDQKWTDIANTVQDLLDAIRKSHEEYLAESESGSRIDRRGPGFARARYWQPLAPSQRPPSTEDFSSQLSQLVQSLGSSLEELIQLIASQFDIEDLLPGTHPTPSPTILPITQLSTHGFSSTSAVGIHTRPTTTTSFAHTTPPSAHTSTTRTTTTSSSPPSSTYTFNPQASDLNVVYYSQTDLTPVIPLTQVCADDSIDMVIVAFVTALFSDGGYPSMNMASNCWAPNAAQQTAGATKLLDCVGDGFAQKIAMCQSRGKKVLLSLGGSVGNLYMASEDQAVQAAHTLWNLFLGGSDPALEPLRPYGDVVFDGIDIDNETPSNAIHLPTLASTLRQLFANDSSKPYYLSAAPQCPRPDASVPVLQLVNVIDFFSVQFYNNPSCQLSSTYQGFYASLQAWSGDLLGAGSGSNNFVQIDNGITSPRLLIGTPAFPAAGAGSTGNKGELEHVIDLDGGCGATGFIGKMSDIAWIRRAFEMVRPDDEGRPGSDVDSPDTPKPPKVRRDYSYFIDETDVLAVDEDIVNPYEWPPGNAAVILTEAHFHAMQGTFHFVLREDFLQKLATFRLQSSLPSWSERRWLAVANLVWAIGAQWLEATKLDQSIQIESHLVYYARARALGIDHRVLIDHPDIERVQGIGLTAFYLLVNGSVTRAWNSLGHAIRHATALGLHLRVSDPSLSEASRECRARTWYSLYSLEILLSEITGRPKAISCAQVTIPIGVIKKSQEEALESTYVPDIKGFFSHSRNTWLDFIRNGQRGVSQGMTGGAVPWRSLASVGQVISSSHLPQRLYLCRLSDKIGFQMYSETSEDSWSETQRKIGDLQSELTDWADKLPEELRMQSDVSVNNDPRVKLELTMYYHSLHMILHRACLCDVVIGHESGRSQEFNRSSARACVHAAMSMMAMLPDYPSAHEAFQLLPWWTLLHYLAQAIVVLLLELALDTQHLEGDEVKELNNHLRKGMAYVWCLAECSLSAYRAWRIFRRLLSDLHDKHPAFDMVDIPLEAPRPAEWSKEHEAALRATLQ